MPDAALTAYHALPFLRNWTSYPAIALVLSVAAAQLMTAGALPGPVLPPAIATTTAFAVGRSFSTTTSVAT